MMTKAELIKVIFTQNEQKRGDHIAWSKVLNESFCEEVRKIYDECPNSRNTARNKARKFFNENCQKNKIGYKEVTLQYYAIQGYTSDYYQTTFLKLADARKGLEKIKEHDTDAFIELITTYSISEEFLEDLGVVLTDDDTFRFIGDDAIYTSERIPSTTKAQIKAIAKYDKANTKQILLKLNKTTDLDILNKLTNESNMQGYIKKLIRRDINN